MKQIKIRGIAAALFAVTLLMSAFGILAYAGDINLNADLAKHIMQKKNIHLSTKPLQNYLFKFNVPVKIEKLHSSVQKAVIFCGVMDKWISQDTDHIGESYAEVPVNSQGSYSGEITLYITEMEKGDPAGVKIWLCALGLDIEGYGMTMAAKGYNGADPVTYSPKPGTIAKILVSGSF